MELLSVPSGFDIDRVDGSGDSGRGVEEACGDRVEVLDFEFGTEGGEGGVSLIDGTCVAGEGDGSVRR